MARRARREDHRRALAKAARQLRPFEAIDGRAAIAFDEKNELRNRVQLSGKMTHGVCLREGECVDYSQPVAIALEDELEVSRTRMVVRVVAQGSVREKPVRATVGLRVRVEQRRKRDSYTSM